jgi:hypothetical protein
VTQAVKQAAHEHKPVEHIKDGSRNPHAPATRKHKARFQHISKVSSMYQNRLSPCKGILMSMKAAVALHMPGHGLSWNFTVTSKLCGSLPSSNSPALRYHSVQPGHRAGIERIVRLDNTEFAFIVSMLKNDAMSEQVVSGPVHMISYCKVNRAFT